MNPRTFYIDYAAGSDGNPGTSKTAPWKTAPGMAGFAGKYSHTAGDRFIFKGGVTWPTSCFQWKIVGSGTASAPDYYGSDPSWFNGASFKRPLFDFERRVIGGWQYGAGVLFEGVQWAHIDNLEFANHAAPLAKAGIQTWGTMTICWNSCNNMTISRCLIRDWWQPNVNGAIESGTSGGGGIQKVNAGSGLAAVDCEFHQLGAGVASGTALWNIVTVERCHIHHTPTAIMSANVVRDNYIHDLINPGDPAAHSNVMLCNGGVIITGNVIHDIPPVAQVMFFAPGYYGVGHALCQGNVVFNVAQPCIAIDTDGQNNPGASIKVQGNTLVGPGGTGYCIRVGNRNNGPLGALDYRDNRLISTKPVSIEAGVTALTQANNTIYTLAQAAAAGLTAANRFGAQGIPTQPTEPPPVEPPPVEPPPTNTIRVFEGKITFDGVWK